MARNRLRFFVPLLGSFILNNLNAMADEIKEDFWKIEDCRVVGKSADIRLSTDGHLSHQTIHFRLVSDVPLKKAPELQLNTAKFTGFELEGTGRGFGFEMLYTPIQVSYLVHDNAALVVGYEPSYTNMDGNFYTYHSVFPMTELPMKIAEVVELCPR